MGANASSNSFLHERITIHGSGGFGAAEVGHWLLMEHGNCNSFDCFHGASVDVGLAKGERDPSQLAIEGGLGVLTGGAAHFALSETGVETTGMTTLDQANSFAPGVAAFGRLSPNASAVLASDLLGDVFGEVAGKALGFSSHNTLDSYGNGRQFEGSWTKTLP